MKITMERDGLLYTFEAEDFDPEDNFLNEEGVKKELDDVEEEDFENAFEDVYAQYSMAVEGINNLLSNIFPEMHGHHLHIVCDHDEPTDNHDAKNNGVDLKK